MYNRSELSDPLPTECPIRLLLSVCPSVSSAFFSEMAQKFFLICGTMVDNWQIVDRCLKTDRALFSCKIHFCSNLGKKDSIWPQNRVFWIFWKDFSLDFLGINLKWKLILFLMFHHQSYIWQNSGSRVVGQNAVNQSNCRIL